RIIKASEILRQKMRREPTPEELSQLTGLSVDVVQSLAALNTGDVRLDAPMDPEGDRSLIERFVADEMPDTEEEAMNRFLNDEIEQALGTLPPRDAKVLRLYFGLEGGREHTLEEIGSMLGVTRERVRQLRDRALKRLREGVTLDVVESETMVIIGYSGTGKSVAIKHIVGLLEPDRGEVWVDGREVPKLPRRELYELRSHIGYVFQFAALFDSMTIGDNVAMGLRKHHHLEDAEIQQRVSEALELVDLPGVHTRFPAELSGGMRKRVGIA